MASETTPSPRACTASRREWCGFAIIALLFCATAYMAGELLLAPLAPRDWLGESSLRGDIARYWADGGPTFLLLALLLLALPFLRLSVRRLRDAGLSPWLLITPPFFFALGMGLMMLYFFLAPAESSYLLYEGEVRGVYAWLALLALLSMAAAPASAAALMLLMACVKSKTA